MGSHGDCVLNIKNLSCVQDFEDKALQILPKKVSNYYAHGAGGENTLANNNLAFKKFRIRPRVMIDVSKRRLKTTILGERVAFPVGVSPWAVHKMAHPDGEIATAQAAGQMNTIFIQSILSTTSIEEVAAAAPETIKWLQLFIFQDRKITRRLVERAEKSGFKAIVLTVDAPELAMRRYIDGDTEPPFPKHLKFVNIVNENDPETDEVGTDEYAKNYARKGAFNPTQTWNDVKWLKSVTKLPIVLKGVLTKEDALIGVDSGADAILVSNHGGRQLDGTPATIEALPEIVQAVGERVEVYLDGGLRSGTDVFIALALGAKMTFVGRPTVWGLVNGGKEGVKKILDILRTELDNVLALSGAGSVQNIQKSMVVHKSYYKTVF